MPSEQKINKKHHTSCQDCLFAITDGITQIGCKFGLIDKWDSIGSLVKVYNETGQFFVVNNRICMHKRTKKWKHADKIFNEQQELVDKELEIKYQAIIFLDSNLGGLAHLLSEMSLQTIKPVHITVVNAFGINRAKPTEIAKILDAYHICPWKIESQMKSMIDEYGFHNDERLGLLDLVLKFTTIAPYYVVYNSGKPITKNFIENTNWQINQGLLDVYAIEGDDGLHELLCNNTIHKILQGNIHNSLINKIKENKGKIWTKQQIMI